jgi:hypothetical protein
VTESRYIWRYFIDKQLLYSDDQKLIPRFINPAPFSKFYLEIDNESPGKVELIGWQIVNSYEKTMKYLCNNYCELMRKKYLKNPNINLSVMSDRSEN